MYRIGLGYDSHRFAEGRPFVLGGVTVESEQGLDGHSDADAVLHAVTDAVLGAIGSGDIGEHFPIDDKEWKNVGSSQFVRYAVGLARQNGYRVGNCDVTVIAQKPRLQPIKQEMKKNIAELLGIFAQDVAVKAKTNEEMGFIGRGEGLAAIAVVILTKENA